MLTYTTGEGNYKDWILGEDEFCLRHQGKGESIFCLANGYMGIRSAHEEPYPFQTRGLFVSGCFNSSNNETVELPNGADTCEMLITLDGELFSMTTGKVTGYSRKLNLYTGELIRKLRWVSPKGRGYELRFCRTVSRSNVHAYGLKAEICPLDKAADIEIVSGINARMTNSGVQHFNDGTKKVLDRQYLYLDQTTTQSNLTLYHCCGSKITGGTPGERSFGMQRRKILETVRFQAEKGGKGCYEKLAVLYTSRDLAEQDEEQGKSLVLEHLENLVEKGYDGLYEESAKAYAAYWKDHDVRVKTEYPGIQLALRFAQYHLLAMIPPDSRSSIAAKGLTGEGYKGHVFWDTEVFILPYYLFNSPAKAKQLLEYRMNRMERARRNAGKKGYCGLMFPWESAESGREETPLFASMDILTGKAAQVWAGIKEHHITADIAYAAWMYELATGDSTFLENGGELLIIGSALFWRSRSIYAKDRSRYEIHDIIGPDEYTEHVDNNAYSNYMAHYVTRQAIHLLRDGDGKTAVRAEEYFQETGILEKLEDFADKLYLPQPLDNPEGVLPQDDTFMSKKILDISGYRNDNIKQTILKDYSREQVNNMQVLKQSDVIMLMELLPDLFSRKIKMANWEYYEPKTIHDSSLSRAIYSVVASDCGEPKKAFASFLHAIAIDMGQNPYSSDEGIHAASMGGIWLAVVRGFAGLRIQKDTLYLAPCLPKEIEEIKFHAVYRGKKMEICVSHRNIYIESRDSSEIPVKIMGQVYKLTHNLDIKY